MANGRMTLSKRGEEILHQVMIELDMKEKRPNALRIAFAKGLREYNGVPEKKERKASKFVIPSGVIAKGEEYLLFKHLIINKVGKSLDGKEIDEFMLLFIEEGLEIMEQEISSMSNLDNYLLTLASKHK
ncbi:hypothetical protein COI93_19035 [Bacillus cereus]|uniref:DUF1832 domain-containing protein n=1 Tax=Bacillus cereus TaxID=1396 RepID=A0A2B0LSY4_BACCE|nr:hypothetical protein COI93_19035 [Bacillus cereus]